MMKALLIAAALVATPALADTTTTNTAPSDGFLYGTGNGYAPANAVVNLNADNELALRFHTTFLSAPASSSGGVYSFALGTTPISFDWSLDGLSTNSLITLTNLLTGQTVSYNPLCPLGVAPCANDNYTSASDPDLAQNSFRLNWATALGFDPTVNDTYEATLTSGAHSVSAFAQLGSGVPAVPEPATWAMMLLGFCGIGIALRKSRQHLYQVA